MRARPWESRGPGPGDPGRDWSRGLKSNSEEWADKRRGGPTAWPSDMPKAVHTGLNNCIVSGQPTLRIQLLKAGKLRRSGGRKVSRN